MSEGLTPTNQIIRSALNFIIFIVITLGFTVFILNKAKMAIQEMDNLANTILQQYE